MERKVISTIYTSDQMRINNDSLIFYNIKKPPFSIHGLYDANNQDTYKRIPDDVAKSTSKGVELYYKNTAGGRLRFATDSDCVAIKVKLPNICLKPHLTMLGASGFDMYIDKNGKDVYRGSFIPPVDVNDEYEGIIRLGNSSFKEITINFPLYNNVDEVQIGLCDGAKVSEHSAYKIAKPILYYGSSITQGCSASRPGTCYEAWISRSLDCDYINLGFAGNCKGEDSIINYMATLDISAFVCDYDHNAPNPQHLSATHKYCYEKMRKANKNIPIILISKPDVQLGDEDQIKRRNIIMKTYQYGLDAGDKNLYFIDGYSLFAGTDREDCTVDGCHPNDLGLYRMADVIGKTIEFALNNTNYN